MLIASNIGELYDIVKTTHIDEVWMIVRSLKNTPSFPNIPVYHVPQLSPSPELFHKYCNERQAGRWNQEAFDDWYVTQFLKEMAQPEAKMMLNKLYNVAKKRNVVIVCFCEDEMMCHRSIVLGLEYGMFMSRGLQVECRGSKGLTYGGYFDMYMSQTMVPIAQGVVNNGVENLPVGNQKYKVMGFTGPRAKKLYGYDKSRYAPLVEKLKERIKYYHEHYGTTDFITGGAQGFDQIAFWAVNSCKREGLHLKNILYLPFPGQETPWMDEGLFSKREYRLMVSLADEVMYCNDKKPSDKSSAVMALFYRNHCIVDKADIMFALFHDDSWKAEGCGGGTGECLRYTYTKGKRFLQLDPEGLNMLSDLT